MIEGVIFDKDGTLLDFHATWDEAIFAVLQYVVETNPGALEQAAGAVGYDLGAQRVRSDSPIIAESNGHIISLLESAVGHLIDDSIAERFTTASDRVGAGAAVAMPGALAVLDALGASGYEIGLATNDSEAVAVAQMAALGWSDRFAAIVGFDSGYGAKPAPGMVLGCAQRLGVDVDRCVMVGDSIHDGLAADAAGAVPILVGRNLCLPGTVRRQPILIDTLTTLPQVLMELKEL